MPAFVNSELIMQQYVMKEVFDIIAFSEAANHLGIIFDHLHAFSVFRRSFSRISGHYFKGSPVAFSCSIKYAYKSLCINRIKSADRFRFPYSISERV